MSDRDLMIAGFAIVGAGKPRMPEKWRLYRVAHTMHAPLSHFNTIRSAEIARVIATYGEIFKGKEVLEIGSGTGLQLQVISGIASSAVGLELRGGAYIRDNSLNVVEYDGLHIPFPTSSFDAVFSSNVMEHIREQLQINKEIRRVLRPGGKVIHVMPTRTWRVLTSLLHYPLLIKKLLRREGQHNVTTTGNVERCAKRPNN